ncbi:hypothetical protein ABIA00_003531 [Bradyrhizobium ottawaense]|uniref:hypothetical protein n=1 Tax=Bradyrhizobium ottawaense TaxID=931866 RepID=UPI003838E712
MSEPVTRDMMSEQIEGAAVYPADIIVLSEAMGIQSLIAARSVGIAATSLNCEARYDAFGVQLAL